MPSLIEQHKKQVVAAKLEKFYSTMNQAIKMAEYENGDKQYWFEDLSGVDDEGNRKQRTWFEKYLAKHLNIIKTEDTSVSLTLYYLADGGAFMPAGNGRDWLYFPGNPKKCLPAIYGNRQEFVGRCAWAFYFDSKSKGFDTYAYAWNGSMDTLYNDNSFGCNTSSTQGYYCTRLIQVNGWKVPDDYPFRISY